MKFPKLKIENFLAITEAEISLADRGLCLIQGRNEADSSAKSNGAGKSSIADALCWCWFGTTARGESGDDVINAGVGKGCRVTSTLVDGGITYTATRHRKHPKGKNRLWLEMDDGLKTTDLTKGTDKLTQEVANRIIGASLDVFTGSIYAGQEKMPDLPAMTDKTLKMLIEEAAGVTLLEEAYRKARDNLAGAQAAVDHATREADEIGRKIVDIDTQITDAAQSETDWESDRTRRVEEKQKEARDLLAIVKRIDADMKGYDRAGIEAEIARIDARIGSVSQESAELARLNREVNSIEVDLEYHNRNYQGAKRNLDNIERQLKDVEGKIGQPCPKCGRPITEQEMAATRNALEKDAAEVRDEAKALKDQIESVESARQKAAQARDAFEGGMTDISAEQHSRKRQEALLADLNDLESDRRLRVTQARALKQSIEDIKSEANPYSGRAEKLRAEKKRQEALAADAAKIVAARREKFEIEEQVVRVFSPAGVRARVLDEVTPFLNTQTARYLSVLSDGNLSANWTTLTPGSKPGEFKEKFSIEVANATGGGKFKLISGGEKRKVRIATSMALQDLVATRASKPIDLFIGDEIDDALDSSGLERLMIILEEKARERGSVFVISHNELSDHIRQVLTIKKTASGETEISEVAV
jgi:DNA repair exonuclease SbcCD ATPase subunit